MNGGLLTPEDAARILAVRKSWVYDACRTGRLPHLKIGRHIRFLEADLDAWVEQQRTPSLDHALAGRRPREPER
jgi:excisionase family DNA binding protein